MNSTLIDLIQRPVVNLAPPLRRFRSVQKSVSFSVTARFFGCFFALALSWPNFARARAPESEFGLFTASTDIGAVTKPGTATYDAAKKTYTIGSSGQNMWSTQDAFQYVWKEVTGDVALAAEISFEGSSTQPHRKACIVFRQSLEPGSIYADVAFHGDGLTSLQFRTELGGITREIQSAVKGPQRVRIEKRGDMIYLYVTGPDGKMQPTGCSVELPFIGPFYIGLGVCSHDPAVFETAKFSNVATSSVTSEAAKIRSSLQTVQVLSGDRRSVYATRDQIEAPNWSRDGNYMVFTHDGQLFHFDLAAGAKPKQIGAGSASNISAEHGFSPDGTKLAITHGSGKKASTISIIPAAGGPAHPLVTAHPSVWHGWSPDGTTLLFSAERDGDSGIYSIPAQGGKEQRLTVSKGLNDGPEFSADGKNIYFNSNRTGTMQIWRMHADGTEQAQVTSDGYSDWFPHPSPDGKWVVFLSYERGVVGQPQNQDVMLRVLDLATGELRVLARFLGGKGSIESPSWAPDSMHLAFISYQRQ